MPGLILPNERWPAPHVWTPRAFWYPQRRCCCGGACASYCDGGVNDIAVAIADVTGGATDCYSDDCTQLNDTWVASYQDDQSSYMLLGDPYSSISDVSGVCHYYKEIGSGPCLWQTIHLFIGLSTGGDYFVQVQMSLNVIANIFVKNYSTTKPTCIAFSGESIPLYYSKPNVEVNPFGLHACDRTGATCALTAS